ncbi:MAG: ACT domain-containing protein, partial [Firmicutes bacterium]|nr:ACT domain-containing protein [Bacillota bacterium]
FDALIDVLGARLIGTRFVVSTKDKGGVLSEVSTIISSRNVNILHMAVLRHEEDNSADMILRVDTLDVEEILQEIEAKGYTVSGVMKNRG